MPPKLYPRILLAVLTGLNILNYIDRNVLFAVQSDVKKEFLVRDAKIGLLTSAFFPMVATTLSGYKLEALRVEERHLLAERRNLDLQEAELLSPARLDQLAKENNLVTPSSAQVVHLEGKSDDAVAMMQK